VALTLGFCPAAAGLTTTPSAKPAVVTANPAVRIGHPRICRRPTGACHRFRQLPLPGWSCRYSMESESSFEEAARPLKYKVSGGSLLEHTQTNRIFRGHRLLLEQRCHQDEFPSLWIFLSLPSVYRYPMRPSVTHESRAQNRPHGCGPDL
jgi:hypothetical protein